MGKMHDALERAEEERERLGGAPGGAVPSDLVKLQARPSGGAHSTDQREKRRAISRARVMLDGIDSSVTDQYRSLRARIQSIRRAHPIRSLVLISAAPGEGKTTSAINLALSFGLERERTTCLVDADLRNPSVHHALSQPATCGLAEILEADAKLEDALIAVPDTRLSVLTVRALPSNPSELLGSQRMVALMDELHSRFDTVIVDSPPILGLPDATELIGVCDAALLVVAAGATPRHDIEVALEQVEAAKVIGTIFNRCASVPAPYGYNGGRG